MRAWIVVVALVAAGLGAAAVRVVVEGRAALREGDDWMLRGKPGEAIAAYETAARWYVPLAPHVDDAYGKLRALTASDDTALPAWRAIRSAARATRSLWTPHAADLADADAAIAKLAARDPEAGVLPADGAKGSASPPADRPSTTADREAWHRARLAQDAWASPGATALAIAGIVGWLAGALVLARLAGRAAASSQKLPRRPALAAAAAIVVGVGCWLVGLYNA